MLKRVQPPVTVGGRPGGSRRGEAGYNLVILMMAVTVMLILVAAVLPAWSTAMRRDREEELIFRGLQYAEAIRVFQQRFGRLPVRLEELIEVEPRCIRQLWADPLTGKRDWQLVRANAPVGARPGGEPPSDDPQGRELGGGEDGEAEGEVEATTPDGRAGLGPIRGVRSRARGESLKTFFDRQRYDQWLFTVDLLQGVGGVQNIGGVGVGVSAASIGLRLQTRWIGRPFPPGLQPGGEAGDPAPPGGGDPPPPGEER